MKRVISLILSVCVVLTLMPAFVVQSEAAPIRSHEIDMPVQTNPLYDDVVDPEHLPGFEKQEDPAHGAEGDLNANGSNPVYTTTYLPARQAVDVLREALKNRETEISIAFTHVDHYEIGEVISALIYTAMEHTGVATEGDYLMWTWATWYPEGEYYSSGGLYYITITYHVTYYTTQAQEHEMDLAVDALLNQLNLYEATDYVKVMGIYDYLCANVTYDFDNLYDDDYLLKYTAYAALMNGTAVCQGYAVLFYRLALELGVDSRVIVGVQTSSGGSHAWNIAKLGETYYNLDATWDAGYEKYSFFLTNEANFYDHTRDPEYNTSEFNGYYPMSGENYLENMQGVLESGVQWEFDPMSGTMFIAGSGAMGDGAYTSPTAVWKKYKNQIWYADIGEGITEIGTEAFMDCTQLRGVKLPNSLEAINNGAFRGSSLPEVVLPPNLKRIGDNAFAYSDLTQLTIPDSVESIGDFAFASCVSLQSISFPKNMTEIPERVCWYCEGLTNVTLPANLVKIGAYAFENCASLQTVALPDSLETISVSAFGNCYAMTELWIPASVHTIEGYGLSGMFNMQKLYFLGNAPAMTSASLDGISGTVYYPRNNPTWTEEFRSSLGGSFTWAAFEPPLTIVEQPKDQTVNVGLTAEFKVSATGSNLTYQWQWRTHSAAGWANSPAAGSNTATVSIPATPERNGFEYRCVITDGQGNVCYSKPAKLTVKPGPKIVSQPASKTVNEGGTATFTVKAEGEGLTYQWQWRTHSAAGWANSPAAGSNTATVSIPATPERNGFEYRCVITDAKGNVSYSNVAKLTVKPGPNITQQPVSQTVNIGGTAKFTVKATGNGLTYQWQWRTHSAAGWANSPAAGNTTATLSVPATPERNGFEYRCKITDANGNVSYSNAAKLTVKPGPSITAQPVNQTVYAGSTAKFTVQATGNGLTYQWQWRTNSAAGWANSPATGNKTATLSVPGTPERSGFEYRCVITDANGNISYSNVAKLTVRANLVITGQPADRTVTEGQTAKFSVAASGEGLTYQWQWRPTSNAPWANAGADGNKTANLNVPGTLDRNSVEYRCKITDAYGKVVYTNIVKLTVRPAVAIKSQPVSQTVNEGTTVYFRVTASGEGLTYQWQWRANAAAAWANSPAAGNKTSTLTVPGTKDRNGFEYRCKVTDAYGNVLYTNTVKLTVRANLVITGQPTDQTVTAGQTAKFSVTAAGDGLTYQWEWRPTSNAPWANAGADGNKTANLNVPGTPDRNSVEYRCKITDAYGNVVYTNSVKLTVKSN